ncbi:hypothetical protein B0H14DRAFT_3476657 [Mycena olivaceomarginata]|nr:hypothetical protein B0H14DRAFT_3476657 [Mycena olivaceomarginata]
MYIAHPKSCRLWLKAYLAAKVSGKLIIRKKKAVLPSICVVAYDAVGPSSRMGSKVRDFAYAADRVGDRRLPPRLGRFPRTVPLHGLLTHRLTLFTSFTSPFIMRWIWSSGDPWYLAPTRATYKTHVRQDAPRSWRGRRRSSRGWTWIGRRAAPPRRPSTTPSRETARLVQVRQTNHVYGAAHDAHLHKFERIKEALGVSVSSICGVGTAQGSAAADADYVDKCETMERMRMYDWACASKPRRPATDDDDDLDTPIFDIPQGLPYGPTRCGTVQDGYRLHDGEDWIPFLLVWLIVLVGPLHTALADLWTRDTGGGTIDSYVPGRHGNAQFGLPQRQTKRLRTSDAGIYTL